MQIISILKHAVEVTSVHCRSLSLVKQTRHMSNLGKFSLLSILLSISAIYCGLIIPQSDHFNLPKSFESCYVIRITFKLFTATSSQHRRPKHEIRRIIIHQTHYEKSYWSRAFNQFTKACELDMINAISAADVAFIMSSSMSA